MPMPRPGDDWFALLAPLPEGVRPERRPVENIGGRYWPDGSFKGTRWKTRTEQMVDADDDGTTTSTTSTPSQPSADDVDALRRIVDEMVKRAGS